MANHMQRVAYLLAVHSSLIFSSAAFAGSGFYIGGDVVNHSLETSTVTYYSSTIAIPTSFGNTKETYTDVGIRTGYKYKNRLTDKYFWAPELSVTSFDGDDLIYSTSLKFGYELAPVEIYATFGASRVKKFTDNRLNYGIGLEYRLTNNSSLNLEWTDYDDITEVTNASGLIGGAPVDIRTDTVRNLNTIKIGYTYYFQGSI